MTPVRYPPHALRWLLVLAALLWGWATPRPAPAAANGQITPLFLGSLTGSPTSTPGAPDALFSRLVSQATTSIDIALYDFDRATVRDALIAAHNRGVTVRVVGDDDVAASTGDGPFYQALTTAGIPLVTDNKSSLMHNKFAVFDGAVTWAGSANFSDTDWSRNANNVLVITDTLLADTYTTEFEEMFGGKFSNDKIDNTPHSLTVGGVALELAFAPTDSVEARAVAALNSANHSIQVAMFTFTSDALGQALIAARQRGVVVEVLLETVGAGVAGGERDTLCAAGIMVRVEDFSGRLHDKYAVVDAGSASDPLVITGSTNWTANATTANDENMLLLHDAELASAFASDFARVRGAITAGAFVCNPAPTSVNTLTYLPLIHGGEAPTPTPTSKVQISKVEYDPPGDDVAGEYVELTNNGTAAALMTGWTLRDEAETVFTFPPFSLGPAASVRVWTKAGSNDSTNLFWGRGQPVWNNSGDTAMLRDDQGTEISRLAYP